MNPFRYMLDLAKSIVTLPSTLLKIGCRLDALESDKAKAPTYTISTGPIGGKYIVSWKPNDQDGAN